MSLVVLQAGSGLAAQLAGLAEGARYVLQSALAIGPAVATVLAVAPMPPRRALAGALLLALVAVGSRWLPDDVPGAVLAPGGLLAPVVLVLLGTVTATGWRLRSASAWVALVVAGIVAGISGGFQTATVDESLGGGAVLLVLVAAGLLVMGAVRLPDRVVRGATLARRMAGAWIAAVGVLLVALLLRGGG